MKGCSPSSSQSTAIQQWVSWCGQLSEWQPEDQRESVLVFIGDHLPKAEIRAGIAAAEVPVN